MSKNIETIKYGATRDALKEVLNGSMHTKEARIAIYGQDGAKLICKVIRPAVTIKNEPNALFAGGSPYSDIRISGYLANKREWVSEIFDLDKNGGIKRVIFNDPVTVVIWSDGTKTIVRCQDGEPYDPEKGLAMCISKKVLGNNGNYYDIFHKYLDEYKEDEAMKKKLAKAVKKTKKGKKK